MKRLILALLTGAAFATSSPAYAGCLKQYLPTMTGTRPVLAKIAVD